jgi:hypothetical protein
MLGKPLDPSINFAYLDGSEAQSWGLFAERSECENARSSLLYHGNIHYHLRSPLTMKAGPKGKAEGRKRRTVKWTARPDPWNKQRMGLARLAIEAEARWLRPEALP